MGYSDQILAEAPPIAQANKLAAYYRLGEASGIVLVDAGPNTLNGTYAASGITYGVPGAIAKGASAVDPNTAVTFAGTSDPATVPDNAAFDLGDGPLSVEFWVKRSTTQSAVQTIVNKGTNAYEVRFDTANKLVLRKSGVSTIVSSLNPITDQAWHHVVVTKVGPDSRLYIDGNDVSGAVTDATLTDTATVLRIGHNSVGSSRFPGSLDEFAIYSRVLDLYDIISHYRAGHPFGGLTYAPPRAGVRRFAVPR